MYTFCPGCCTTYRITVEQLGAAGGKVRCGDCRQVFSAVDYLYETLSLARVALFTYRAGLEAQEAEEKAGSQTDIQRQVSEPVLANTARLSQQFVWKDITNGALAGLLVLVLGLQWVYFHRNSMASSPAWRPVLQSMCEITGCTLPFEVALDRIQLVNRDVRKHPRVENGLLVNATFSNRAGFIQPYPVFEVSFSDLAGKPVAMRRFHPDEYLADPGRIASGLAVDQPVQVVLELQDPGDKAVSFQFGFL